jgi:hypothetical protein
MAPQEVERSSGPGPQKGLETVDTKESSAPHAHPSTEDQDHPHACLEGVVYIGHLAAPPDDGEEVEVVEAVPCRRCASDVR